MIEHHATMARSLGEQLGLPEPVLQSLTAAYEQWDGRGWPGELSGAEVPLPSRIAQLAEYVEVAHRVGGVDAAKELARDRLGKQFDPALAELICTDDQWLRNEVEAFRLGAADPARAAELLVTAQRARDSMRAWDRP